MSKLTLKIVSERLGVSTATVSNAFNRPSQLSKQLREHILEQCQLMGYYGPNTVARSLKVGKTGIMGVVLADRLQYNFSDYIATRFLKGVAEIFDANNINLLLLPGRQEFYTNRTIDSLADGFILYGPPHDQEVYSRLIAQNKPLVTVDFDLPNITHIHVDNYKSACELVELGLEQPASQVAILGLKLVQSDRICRVNDADLFDPHYSVSRQRLEGYLSCYERLKGERLAPQWIWSVPESNQLLGYQAAREALMCTPRPDVFFCMSDRIAIGVMLACQELQLRVPEDVKVLGFDDIPEAEHYGLSTTRQPQKTKGKIAAEMLLGLKPMQNWLLDTQLKPRHSSKKV